MLITSSVSSPVFIKRQQSKLQTAMAKTLLIAAFVAVTYVLAEPPVPSRQYLPGNQQPSSSYGAPSVSGRFGNGGAPSSQYGAPVPSSRFGNGASKSGNGRNGGARAPSSTYGAPGASSRFGGSNGFGAAPSSTYGAPSSQYGAPAASSQFGGANSIYAANGGYARGGFGAQEDDMSEPANYQFSYEVKDDESGVEFGQEESRQEDFAKGSYQVLLPDGRLQIVEYEADAEGYRPKIRYEDTGAGAGGYGRGPAQRGQGQGPY